MEALENLKYLLPLLMKGVRTCTGGTCTGAALFWGIATASPSHRTETHESLTTGIASAGLALSMDTKHLVCMHMVPTEKWVEIDFGGESERWVCCVFQPHCSVSPLFLMQCEERQTDIGLLIVMHTDSHGFAGITYEL